MIAYKFLRADGTTVFSGFRWPMPQGGRPGAWLEAAPVPCRSGIHACRPVDLPLWAGPVLYEVELGGDVVEDRSKVVAARGRIVRRIDEWDDAAREAYTRMCADRARDLVQASGRPLQEWADIAAASVTEGPALLGFVAARVAEEIEGASGYHRERAAQARWFADLLHL